MLKSLRIKNYAIIDDLYIDFTKGFNVFTGETGAGKSIIVGALSLLLKGRGDVSFIKKDADKAIIEGVFSIDDENLVDELACQDIEYDDELIIKRVIGRDNHNSIKINQSSVTLNYLNDLLSKYIDIHSQKDSQFLFIRQNQLNLLDKFSDNNNLLLDYQSSFSNYNTALKEYDNLFNNSLNSREIEFYHFDYDELNDANISVDEENNLLDLEKSLKTKEKYSQLLNDLNVLYKNDGGLKEKLFDLLNSLSLDDKQIINYKDKINDLYYSLDDVMSDLYKYLQNIVSDEMDVEAIQERLFVYSKLKRKHKTDTNGLIKLKSELETKIKAYEQKDELLVIKANELEKLKKEALEKANKLHDVRYSKSQILAKEVLKETADLLLPNCNFVIDFKEAQLNRYGYDEIDFLISMNKGEDLKPLRNVASGGEMSRLLLALKSVFCKYSAIDLLILDEIDTGVSGRVATAVGEKIAKIAKNIQVLCISHLAPVAAFSDNHFLIYKEDDEINTNTHVKQLNNEEIIKELASISNNSINEKAIEAAKELYNNCQNLKNNI